MFAIYNTQGRRFRDNLENLKKVHRPDITHKVPFHVDTAQDETVVIQGSSSETSADGRSDAGNQKATKAYQEMLHINDRTPICHVHQLMSHPVVTISMNASIEEAYHLFRDNNFNQMPVVDTEHKIVGLITIQGLLRFMLVDNEEVHFIADKTVGDAMSKEVITADPVTDIRRVASAMLEYHLDGIPVVNETDQLIGIVSRSDIMRAVINDPPLSLWS